MPENDLPWRVTSILGAELKKCKGLCVNYFKRRDLHEKRIILHNLNSQKWFKIYKIMPETFVFQTQTKGLVVVGVALGEIVRFTNEIFRIGVR